jgi:YD repeat-containing protein
VQAAQRQLQQQIDAAEQLQQDMEALKTENLEAWRQKYDLEGQLAAARANMEGMRGQADSMQQVGLCSGCVGSKVFKGSRGGDSHWLAVLSIWSNLGRPDRQDPDGLRHLVRQQAGR